ncbi:hypothetical protein BLNAU_7814 [Blattamonas nauphoetae]|uniref:Uncharacterized protein n=1 Tax=Blattamonas nauphoetae TaxID=2049346 RepID=A0ABQ9Y0G4_9EUKA|nr:hypothetical protein BLNAU_7814 [Blattamonas nauphoetae]
MQHTTFITHQRNKRQMDRKVARNRVLLRIFPVQEWIGQNAEINILRGICNSAEEACLERWFMIAQFDQESCLADLCMFCKLPLCPDEFASVSSHLCG